VRIVDFNLGSIFARNADSMITKSVKEYFTALNVGFAGKSIIYPS
jgi:hypothetical protein